MISIGSLWLVILLSAVVTFAASSVIWMFMPHHKSDHRKLPDEESVRAALGPQNAAPGMYTLPYMKDPGAMKDPDMQQKLKDGPVGILTIWPNGVPTMGKSLTLGFIFYVLVGILVAYATSRSFGPGADYMEVFQVASATAFMCHGVGVIPASIWFGQPWSNTIKQVFDALVYALLVAGVFGWLWPA